MGHKGVTKKRKKHPIQARKCRFLPRIHMSSTKRQFSVGGGGVRASGNRKGDEGTSRGHCQGCTTPLHIGMCKSLTSTSSSLIDSILPYCNLFARRGRVLIYGDFSVCLCVCPSPGYLRRNSLKQPMSHSEDYRL